MARRSWRELFRREVSTEVQTPQRYLEHAKKCMEQAQRMTSSAYTLTFTPLQFNHGQCEYLAKKLKVAVRTSEKWASSCLPSFAAESVQTMKLLCRTAKEVESFIQGCRKDNWIQAAMVLANTSEYVSQLSSELHFCTLLLRYSGLRSKFNTLGESWRALAEFESDVLAESELLKERVSRDQSYLLTKLENVRFSSNEESQSLAKCLSSRLRLQIYLSRSDLELSDWEIHLSSLTAGQKLGSGASAVVRKSIWLGADVAEKVFEGSLQSSFLNEVKILAGLAHPNIVPLLGYATEGNRCFIVMELMDGDLSSLMEERKRRRNPTCAVPFTDFETVDMMLQTAEGMLYLHDNKVVHRDLKSANILVKSREDDDAKYICAKVTDFGLSKTKETSCTYSNQTMNTGTTRWMAPELIQLPGEDLCAKTSDPKLRYHFKVDVYSFGMVCYEILTGKVPFSTINSPKEVKKMVLNGDRPELPDHCPHFLKTLICSCWDAKPSRRPSFLEICKRLRCLKWLLMRGCKSTVYADHIESDPAAAFEATRTLTDNFTDMEALKDSKTMFSANMGDCFVLVMKSEKVLGTSEEQEFQAQVLQISKLNHKNVLKIIGWQLEEQSKVVLYEYTDLGLLLPKLHGTGGEGDQNAPVLTWMQRVKIAVGVAKGLEFLHGQKPCISHGSISVSSIVMFDNDVAKIGYFTPPLWSDDYFRQESGIIDCTRWSDDFRRESAIIDYTRWSDDLRQESDIFNFGYLLLELLTGEQMQDMEVRRSTLAKITPDGIMDHSVVDRRLSSNYPAEGADKMAAIALSAIYRMDDTYKCVDLHILVEALQLLLPQEAPPSPRPSSRQSPQPSPRPSSRQSPQQSPHRGAFIF